MNDILQRNQTLHTLLKSPLVSHTKNIFAGGLQAAGQIAKYNKSREM